MKKLRMGVIYFLSVFIFTSWLISSNDNKLPRGSMAAQSKTRSYPEEVEKENTVIKAQGREFKGEQFDTPDEKQQGAFEAPSERSKRLNAEGYNLYKQSGYKDALDRFKQSFEADDANALAHYNYACTLGLLMKQDYEDWFSYKKEAIEHLWKAKNSRPEYGEKIKTDPDLDLIRSEFQYYLIIGLSHEKTEDAKVILRNLKWYVRGEGAISVLGGLGFLEDDTFLLWYYDLKNFDEGIKKIKYCGRYEVKGNRITLVLDEKMLRRKSVDDIFENYKEYENDRTLNGVLSKEGIIQIDNMGYPFTYWFDEFSA